MTEKDQIELGGNIFLSGFKDVERGSMIVLKKIIGNYVHKFREHEKKYVSLSINKKDIHGGKSFELNGEIKTESKKYNSEVTSRNLYIGIDTLLKKLEKLVGKE